MPERRRSRAQQSLRCTKYLWGGIPKNSRNTRANRKTLIPTCDERCHREWSALGLQSISSRAATTRSAYQRSCSERYSRFRSCSASAAASTSSHARASTDISAALDSSELRCSRKKLSLLVVGSTSGNRNTERL